MSADLAMTPVQHPAMPAALMLLLGAGVSTLAAYVSLDLARRVRVLWTRAGLLWLLGAAWALSLGVWSCQIIGVAAEPIPFSLGYDGLGSLLAWGAAIVACAAGLGAVSGRVATPARLGFGAFALGTSLAPTPTRWRRSACSRESSGVCCR